MTTKATRKSKIPRRPEGLTYRVNTEYLHYAQKIINQSLSTLSKVYKEQTGTHSQVIKTSVNCLVEVTLYCIQVLEGLEKAEASCKPLDIEKAYSNIIARMIKDRVNVNYTYLITRHLFSHLINTSINEPSHSCSTYAGVSYPGPNTYNILYKKSHPSNHTRKGFLISLPHVSKRVGTHPRLECMIWRR